MTNKLYINSLILTLLIIFIFSSCSEVHNKTIQGLQEENKVLKKRIADDEHEQEKQEKKYDQERERLEKNNEETMQKREEAY
ncbi:MAG: hypothetical protein LBI18_04595, partial [Planctomycetaceae bacterium]|nr:hypothetical protein [Planctomycetaceae bacterium]